MKSFIFVLVSLAFFSLCLGDGYGNYGSYWGGGGAQDKVLLDGVRALTLENGKYTQARRVSAIPQLQCVGGDALGYNKYYPKVVQCVNVGGDGAGDVNWECKADLDSDVRFGKTIVSCEGYDYSEDPYILKGSCGLEYELEFTSQGRQRQQGGSYSSYGQSAYAQGTQYYQQSSNGSGWASLIFFGIFAFIIFGLVRQCMQNSASGTYGSGSSTYGSGSGSGYGNGYGTGSGSSSYGGYPSAGCAPSAPSYSTYRPGFWSGLGGGSLLGYLFGRGRTGSSYYNPTSSFGSSYGSSYRPSASFSAPSSSRSSSGFATTKRR